MYLSIILFNCSNYNLQDSQPAWEKNQTKKNQKSRTDMGKTLCKPKGMYMPIMWLQNIPVKLDIRSKRMGLKELNFRNQYLEFQKAKYTKRKN